MQLGIIKRDDGDDIAVTFTKGYLDWNCATRQSFWTYWYTIECDPTVLP